MGPPHLQIEKHVNPEEVVGRMKLDFFCLVVGSPMSTTEEQSGPGLYTLKSKGQGGSGFQVQLLLEGKQVSMEVDTGSAVSIVSKVRYEKWFKHLKLQPKQFNFTTYSGESLPLLEEIRPRKCNYVWWFPKE